MFSPPLADKVAIVASGDDVNAIARQLIEVVRPDIFVHIHRIEAAQRKWHGLPVRRVPIAEIKFDTKIYHPHLTPQQMVRIRNIQYILQDVDDTDLEEMVANFKKDLRISEEIFIWEGIAAAYGAYKMTMAPPLEELREAYHALLQMSIGMLKDVLENDGYRHLDRGKRECLLEIWSKVPDEVAFVHGEP